MRILLCGATGTLGSRIASLLAARGHAIALAGRDRDSLEKMGGALSRVESIHPDAELPDRGGFDAVVNAAGAYGRNGEGDKAVFEANYFYPLRILDFALGKRIPFYLSAGTVLKLDSTPYFRSKKEFAQEAARLSSGTDTCFTEMALELFYGPGISPEKNFVARLIRDLRMNLPEIALTPGRKKRAFTYIDDVASAFVLTLEHAQKGVTPRRIEVGASARHTIMECAVALKKRLNAATRLRFGALPYRASDVSYPAMNTDYLRSINWKESVTFQEGLENTILFEEKK